MTTSIDPEIKANQWVLLFQIGNQTARGFKQQFVLRDSDHAQQVIDRTNARLGGTKLLVDYEHQSTHTETNGKPAPAAGWVQEMRQRAERLVFDRICME